MTQQPEPLQWKIVSGFVSGRVYIGKYPSSNTGIDLAKAWKMEMNPQWKAEWIKPDET